MRKTKRSVLIILLILAILGTNDLESEKLLPSIKFYAQDDKQTDEDKIEELEKKIEKQSKTIKENDQKIEGLKAKISTNEKKVNSTNKSIEKLTKEIKKEEKLVNSYLKFLQRLNNQHIWLEQLENGHILEYAYNFENVVQYINKDFQQLNSNVSTLEFQKKEYNSTLKELNSQKENLEEENKKTNKIYKQLNEELIELEKEVNYEIEYDEDASIAEEDREKLMKNVGIADEDFEYVDYIVFHESSWNFKVSNPYSGAYGLCQSLPGDKMSAAGEDWKTNPETQLAWCDGYAKSRYGSWEEAKVFWEENSWW